MVITLGTTSIRTSLSTLDRFIQLTLCKKYNVEEACIAYCDNLSSLDVVSSDTCLIPKNSLSLNLKLKLYETSVCSLLTYGCETWDPDTSTCKTINGDFNNVMLVRITDYRLYHTV